MNIRVRKIYEALFALEDLRELFRHALPTGLGEDGRGAIFRGYCACRVYSTSIKKGEGG